MKRMLSSVSAVAVLYSCKKDEKKDPPYKCATCISAPEAKAANDAS